MSKKVIYLDNGASTRMYDEVLEEMKSIGEKFYANPGSEHTLGEVAMAKLNEFRSIFAKKIGAKSHEIVFTSGGTESNNIALLGVCMANQNKKKRKIIISKIEHSSVWECAESLKRWGYDVKEVGVDREGIVSIEELEKEIDSETLVVSIMHVNNEIGSIQDITRIGKLCRAKGAIFHTDAVQSFGKENIDVNSSCIDIMSASAHKIGGPKGTGFLFVRDNLKISPVFHGGEQERKLRPGTENIMGVAGFAKALEISSKTDRNEIRKIRDKFENILIELGAKINGSRDIKKRMYCFLNVRFPNINSESLVIKMSEYGIMASTKSACLDKEDRENRVLRSIGLNQKEINESLRFVINHDNTEKEVLYVAGCIKKILADL